MDNPGLDLFGSAGSISFCDGRNTERDGTCLFRTETWLESLLMLQTCICPSESRTDSRGISEPNRAMRHSDRRPGEQERAQMSGPSLPGQHRNGLRMADLVALERVFMAQMANYS